MVFRLCDNVALRSWKSVDRALVFRYADRALPVSKEEWEILLRCDGILEQDTSPVLQSLLQKGYIEECEKGRLNSQWSKLRAYDNPYFPRMNLMVTGKCNLNCLHCFNAKDNAPLNSEWDYQELLSLLDQAKDIGILSFTLTGGEPMVHPRFLDIVKEIYQRDMSIFEINTNGFFLTQEILDTFNSLRCHPLIKISYDGVGTHNWLRQNPSAEAKTIEAIKLCVKNGFPVKAQVQVHRKNVHTMMDTARLLSSLGVAKMRVIRTTEAPRWELTSPDSSLPILEYYDKMLEFAKRYQEEEIPMELDIWLFLRLFPKHKIYSIVPIASCPESFHLHIPLCRDVRSMVAISSDGQVVPCLQMSGGLAERGIYLNNVKDTPLKEIVSRSDYSALALATVFHRLLANPKCPACPYFKYCLGGCPALGLLSSGEDRDYFHEDYTKCLFFENGYYDKIVEAFSSWKLENPMKERP